MNHLKYELKPLYTNQKSFYSKAQVAMTKYDMDERDGVYHGGTYYVLQSYDTVVAIVYAHFGGMPYAKKLWDGYSRTTMRHVNELLMQLGFPKLSARVWRAMKVDEYYHPDEIPALDLFTK